MDMASSYQLTGHGWRKLLVTCWPTSSSADLRLQAALALGEFAQIDGVLARLSAVCLAQDESIDLRYAAFTSLERAGPTPECIALLRQVSNDDTLGSAARSVLLAWHVE